MNRVWINRNRNLGVVAVWVELGGNQLLWIMSDGRHGITLNSDEWNNGESLTTWLVNDPVWEEL